MDELKCRLGNAIAFAIETNNDIYYKAIKIKQRINEAKNVCVFGTGEFFEGYHVYLNRIDFVCDNDKSKSNTTIMGFKCYTPDKLKEIDDLVVIIMVGNYNKIRQQLNKMQVENYLFTELFMNVYTDYHNSHWFEIQKEKILAAYEVFEDNISRECFAESICHRIAPHLCKKTFHEIECANEYFNSELYKVKDNDVYVDAGAYDGDTIESYIEFSHGRYRKIYAFELDKKNYIKMQKRLSKYMDGRIVLLNYGCSDTEQDIKYVSNETGSNVNDKGNESARLVKIDDYVHDEVTLVKMDIEGAENAALEGARAIILRDRPKLIISAYHRLEDLWDIPFKIKELDDSYKLYMRHHSPMVWDTDCYAL